MTTERDLRKLPKHKLAEMHASNGGLMGLGTYLKWTKDELVSAVLEDIKMTDDARFRQPVITVIN